MTTAVATVPATGKLQIIEEVITKGDLAKLSPQERTSYYMQVCESVGLNPLTKPFEYINLNNKLTLYALRTCTDQLRTIHKVSVIEMTETERDGVFIVTAKVQNGDGRTDISKGAVNISSLKGEALANAMMKAETKAKRRATLSICGLGWLDETEVETIPGARPQPQHSAQPQPQQPAQSMQQPSQAQNAQPQQPQSAPQQTQANPDREKQIKARDWCVEAKTFVLGMQSRDALDQWATRHAKTMDAAFKLAPNAHKALCDAIEAGRANLHPMAAE